ncbi:hypothetical protein GCM10027598_60910 [Amycolatopsis oliviviridis]|uniref:Uncharacterized protein n=1 Tax=Amycolatopsis oliviviridis TaxID=1471590 RepID=A0ABQ3M9I1_9PSEU|nr:hypothetical protein [Amycolatopsis oliviviridis]GHH32302.1 hypothetical protein GCM10017790_69210 [Amycolatopsis oliviviridis]
MHRTPGAYAAWVHWLGAFGRGEDLPSGHLVSVGVDLGPQMLERLTRHIAEAFHARQRKWSDALIRDQQMLLADPARAVTAIAVILADARRRLRPLVALTGHPALPAELRESLATALKETVTSSQRSLEDSAREAPVELRNAIRQNSLIPALTRSAVAPSGGAPTRRRIILK